MTRNYYNCETQSKPSCTCNNNHDNHFDYALDSSYVIGNSVKFCIDECDNEIKADITVDTRATVRIWGQITDCNSNPVPYAYVKLAKVCEHSLEGVAHTVTDCLGYYQFDVCPSIDGCEFTLIVGKASVGAERIVSTGIEGTACNPCTALPKCAPCNTCKPNPCRD